MVFAKQNIVGDIYDYSMVNYEKELRNMRSKCSMLEVCKVTNR